MGDIKNILCSYSAVDFKGILKWKYENPTLRRLKQKDYCDLEPSLEYSQAVKVMRAVRDTK